MIDNWNRVVRPEDKVYHLGDVATAKAGIGIIGRLNGTKVLIRGNHDIFKLKEYAPYFKDVRGSHKLGAFILSHIPVHPGCLEARWCDGNIHGHMHNNVVTNAISGLPDPRYFNVSVERVGYTPIPFDDVANKMRAAQGGSR